MMWFKSLKPRKNLVLDKFFKNYPPYHFFKFMIDKKLNRAFAVIFFKTIYWIGFKVMNRIELRDKENIFPLQKGNEGKPFLIIVNHCAGLDVIMHTSIWAHLGFFTRTFTSEYSFDPKHYFFPMLTHFIEMIPRYGPGESSIKRMVNCLIQGDVVKLYPEGSYPSGKYFNSGFTQEPYTGSARVVYNYWKKTGEKLVIQPVGSLGANRAYPPKTKRIKSRPIRNHKIIVKFGQPFTIDFSDNPSHEEFKQKAVEMQMHIAQIWGQKHLIPNRGLLNRRMEEKGDPKPRIYKILK